MSRLLRRCALFCVALAGLSVSQPAALALSVEPITPEHDWTVEVGACRFGLEQTAWGSSRTTTIYWGGGEVETNWLAWTIVMTAAGALATVIAAAGLVFAVFARRSNGRDAGAV